MNIIDSHLAAEFRHTSAGIPPEKAAFPPESETPAARSGNTPENGCVEDPQIRVSSKAPKNEPLCLHDPSDLALMQLVLDTDNPLAAAQAEVSRLTAELEVVKLSRDGYRNQSVDLGRLAGHLQRRVERSAA